MRVVRLGFQPSSRFWDVRTGAELSDENAFIQDRVTALQILLPFNMLARADKLVLDFAGHTLRGNSKCFTDRLEALEAYPTFQLKRCNGAGLARTQGSWNGLNASRWRATSNTTQLDSPSEPS